MYRFIAGPTIEISSAPIRTPTKRRARIWFFFAEFMTLNGVQIVVRKIKLNFEGKYFTEIYIFFENYDKYHTLHISLIL